ncbi:MAG: riboflavin synthase [Anaerovibrio sp.]|uniref:riboflavin synthase n=1 Tax=Anaerovibrio sp. TaxID=1872532 RepID=UPI0025CCA850|nr:riboflavin synthase [Anaerovibrio sp.]MCR5176279.1 riboflavin synthase [Anaerovibrio sp.]
MFTGIIEEVGSVAGIGSGVLTIKAEKVLSDVQLGDSIAVNGVCLTVAGYDGSSFKADVMPETIRRTSFAELKKGSPVNLERALTLQSRLGGHIVSGHIDGVGRIVSLQEDKNAILMKISASDDILRHIVEKGSVALDGISLTVAQVTDGDFTVSLIPHTRQVTNLSGKRVGSLINIENDVIGKYVEKLLGQSNQNSPSGSRITMEFLNNNGF